jgi:hypothetical protein
MASPRDRYLDLLFERIREDAYPSGALLDRAEAALTRREQLDAYLDLLLEKADESWYPSHQMLDRIARLSPP